MTFERKSKLAKTAYGGVMGSLPVGILLIYNTLQSIEKKTERLGQQFKEVCVGLEKVSVENYYMNKELAELSTKLDKHIELTN
jgi:hypothetical protein